MPPHVAAPAPGPEAIVALDRAHVIHPINEFAKHETRGALVFTGGEGVHLETADGRRRIDGFSGLFNVNVGHGRREIADAVSAQMCELAYSPSFWDFGNAPAARLAERLVGLLPADRGLRNVLYHAVRGRPEKTRLERERLVENAREVGAHLLERLRQSLSDSPIVGEVRGLGTLAALEIVRDRESGEPFPNPGDPHWIARAALDRGLVCRALFQCVGLAPPLCATREDVDRMVDVLEDVWPEAERRARESA